MGLFYIRPALRAAIALPGGGGFVGPYDAIPNITAAYGMRRLLSSYTGNLLRIRRNSDQGEQDFGYLANGDLDVAAIATFLTATTGQITTWYDQSGNGNNATQSTANNQPLYVASGQNSKPILRFDGANDGLATDYLFDLATSKTLSFLLLGKSTTNNNAVWLAFERSLLQDYTSGLALYNTASADNNDLVIGKGNGGTALSEFRVNRFAGIGSSFLLLAYLISTTGLAAYKNGGLQTLSNPQGTLAIADWLSAGSGSHRLTIGARSSGANDTLNSWHNGDLCEIVIANTVWSDANRQAAEAAANAYWSIY